MKIQVTIYQKAYKVDNREVCGAIVRSYIMDHDDYEERFILNEQCRNAFKGGQTVITCPITL